ncbi:ragulator complex protein LAMTOR4 [Planococcus citri]|uniref:ragulator complex protein LAMTOR4 n=1 Tax=Planococcus citri TaxID=170843 RepID=UPI0031F7232B
MDRVSDQLGYLVLYLDGTVLCSNGDLENNEHTANLVSSLVTIAKNIPPHEEKFKKISILYPDVVYAITLSNARIYVSKLKRPRQITDHSDFINF